MTRFFIVVLVFFVVSAVKLNASELTISGKLMQGGFVIGQVAPGEVVRLDGASVRTTGEGQFVIGFGRDHPETSVLEWGKGEKGMLSRVLTIEQREYRIQRVEGVPQQTVNPPPERLARIKSETALVKNARKIDSDLKHFLQVFMKPLNGPITGVYGSQRVYNGVPKRPHYGLDYAAPVGTIVKAPADGVVTLVHNNMFYSGGTLIVDHGYGVSSTFIHLSEVLVRQGDEVSQGDPIAKVGKGGRSTGPHLDWRVNWYDVRIDPALVLAR